MGKADRAIDGDRLSTLHRVFKVVPDGSIALVAGLDDEDWLGHIAVRFTKTHAVPPGEVPAPIDDMQLPYCGLIVLHLDPFDTLTVLVEARNLIKRCQPALLIGCQPRDGQHGDLSGHFLERLGAREIFRAGPDRIFGWAR